MSNVAHNSACVFRTSWIVDLALKEESNNRATMGGAKLSYYKKIMLLQLTSSSI